MSYHYSIEPSIVIVDTALFHLNRKFNTYSVMGMSDILSQNGYPTYPESFSPDEISEIVSRPLEPWEYMDGLAVHVGWTPEYQGLKGIVERFMQFVKFIDYNLPYGDYVITDDYGDKATLRVIDGECSIVDM